MLNFVGVVALLTWKSTFLWRGVQQQDAGYLEVYLWVQGLTGSDKHDCYDRKDPVVEMPMVPSDRMRQQTAIVE
ncbi:hypothetical protein CLCR_09378 [Cladophialophora carrionii]|uniref:Secreted protein n=1 Tax=Cladophialophora carrionii TaxID=86049 RepID=A0A1C1CST6_9EURO|nr:hypothetical protein CLCR_09378 [Cladophialophora carrionii]